MHALYPHAAPADANDALGGRCRDRVVVDRRTVTEPYIGNHPADCRGRCDDATTIVVADPESLWWYRPMADGRYMPTDSPNPGSRCDDGDSVLAHLDGTACSDGRDACRHAVESRSEPDDPFADCHHRAVAARPGGP